VAPLEPDEPPDRPQDEERRKAVPDCWPPADGAEAADAEDLRELPEPPPAGPFQNEPVPLFPLADVWLLPGVMAPLNIFEPRYRQMIEDCLDRSGRLVIGTVRHGQEHLMPGKPQVYPVAGLGEIVKHERRSDGTFIILLLGIGRVELAETDSSRLYRRVLVRPLAERPVPAKREALYRRELTQAVLARSEQFLNLPENIPLAALADLLSLRLCLPHTRRQRLFAEPDVESRVLELLAEHRRRPPDQKPREEASN
jgi:Lon protease-like protein